MKLIILLVAVLCLVSCKQDPAPSETTTATTKTTPAAVNPAIDTLFETVNVVKMHAFGTNEAEPKAENYPYAGKPVGEDALKYLADDMQPNEAGHVYACYFLETSNFYVLRVPGKYASSDLVLAKWDPATSKMVKVLSLATIQCDEGLCHQQDAWLTDLDDDRSLELVVRSHTNDNGKVSNESFSVMAQQPPGSFTPAPENLASLAPPTSYVLRQLK